LPATPPEEAEAPEFIAMDQATFSGEP